MCGGPQEAIGKKVIMGTLRCDECGKIHGPSGICVLCAKTLKDDYENQRARADFAELMQSEYKRLAEGAVRRRTSTENSAQLRKGQEEGSGDKETVRGQTNNILGSLRELRERVVQKEDSDIRQEVADLTNIIAGLLWLYPGCY